MQISGYIVATISKTVFSTVSKSHGDVVVLYELLDLAHLFSAILYSGGPRLRLFSFLDDRKPI